MIYFFADSHFGHDREFIYKDRGCSSIEEHDSLLIKNFNSIVKSGDEVYFLGDFAPVKPNDYFKALICDRWNFILGNHDKKLIEQLSKSRIVSVTNGFLDIKYYKQKITLSHFPMMSWEASHWNSWNLYGHVHLKTLPIQGKMMDVSPTKDHLYPYSLDEVYEHMRHQPDNWDLIIKES